MRRVVVPATVFVCLFFMGGCLSGDPTIPTVQGGDGDGVGTDTGSGDTTTTDLGGGDVSTTDPGPAEADVPEPGCQDGDLRCANGAVEQCEAGGWKVVETCSSTCVDGACVCAPACDGKACGDDGCGGLCGTCAPDEDCEGGLCVAGKGGACLSEDDLAIVQADAFKSTMQKCGMGTCAGTPDAQKCIAQCVVEDSGLSFDCAVCFADHLVCIVGSCMPVCMDGGSAACQECMKAKCEPDLFACAGFGGGCQPSCEGKSCGDNGCGGSCGMCGPDEACIGGQCSDGGGSCSSEADSTILDTTDMGAISPECGLGCLGHADEYKCSLDCIVSETGLSEGCADCFAKHIMCAIDNCIPQCLEPESSECKQCMASECEPKLFPCVGGCSSSCDGKSCGNNGCGGSCGTCGPDEMCMGGKCMEATGACTSPSDLAVFMSGEIESVGPDCGLGCLDATDQYTCSLDCIMTKTGLSQGCAECFADQIMCVISECVPVCLTPESDDCDVCIEAKCNPGFFACAGVGPG